MFTYASVEDLIDAATNGTGHSHDNGDHNGSDVQTFEDAVTLHREGWTPGMDTIKSAIERIELPSIDLRRVRLTMDVAGGSVDMGRYMANDPECMRRIVMAPSKPVVRIAVNAGYAATVSASQVLANGAPIVALCDLLASAGFGVEIDAVTIKRAGSEPVGLAVNVKRANQPIDLGTFAFAIAHAAFNRRLVWGALEVQGRGQTWGRHFTRGGGYGSANCEPELRAYCQEAGYDLDFSGYPVHARDALDRVVNAVRAWMSKVTPDAE